MIDILTIIILVNSAAIFGYAFACTAVAHPAMMNSPVETAVSFFKPFFQKSAHLQLIISLILMALCILMSWLTKQRGWATAGIVLQLSGPYTIKILMPVNNRIMAEGADPHSEQMAKDLKGWGPLHLPRTLLAGSVFIYLAYLAVAG